MKTMIEVPHFGDVGLELIHDNQVVKLSYKGELFASVQRNVEFATHVYYVSRTELGRNYENLTDADLLVLAFRAWED